jgi:putative ABC transport system permease protein
VFTGNDVAGAPRVAVIDESFAKYFWKDEDPIGKRIRHGGDTSSGAWMTVIGVVRSVKHTSLDERGDLQMYEHFAQRTTWNNYLVVRTDADAAAVVPELRRALRSVDPAIPLYEVGSMRESVARSLSTRRLTSVLLAGFATTALLLAAIGIYGVMALGVTGRVREFGIRLALGANPRSVRALVLGQAARIALVGVAIGLAAAVATTRYLTALLFGVQPLDWVTFAGVALLLSATGLVASYLPALRATRADPLAALREE